MEDISTGQTFNDVLFVPQYSEVKSRRNNDTTTDMGRFKLELPVVSANMKDITGPKMAAHMAKHGGLGILHRFGDCYDSARDFQKAQEIAKDIGVEYSPYNIGVSIGAVESEKERLAILYKTGARTFVIDVAHGHHILVKNMISYIRSSEYSDIYIIAGNVATVEGARDLIKWGADAVKVGIGPGCFVCGTKVKTSNGLKNIEDIVKGDDVLTHRGRYKKVEGTTSRQENDTIMKINGINCTSNHEFYVLAKKYKHIVNDENINEYAEWVGAGELTKDYYLLEIKE